MSGRSERSSIKTKTQPEERLGTIVEFARRAVQKIRQAELVMRGQQISPRKEESSDFSLALTPQLHVLTLTCFEPHVYGQKHLCRNKGSSTLHTKLQPHTMRKPIMKTPIHITHNPNRCAYMYACTSCTCVLSLSLSISLYYISGGPPGHKPSRSKQRGTVAAPVLPFLGRPHCWPHAGQDLGGVLAP